MKRSLFIILILTSFLVRAQNADSNYIEPPKALLLEIFTRQESIAWLQNHNHPDRAQRMANDCEKVKKVMIRDWEDHFSFCPVYYFYDTVAERIKNHDFNGTLLDKNLQPVSDPEFLRSKSAYFIGYIGYVPQNNKGIDATSLFPMLIACDENFEMLHYVHIISSASAIWKREGTYSHISRYFDLDYFPVATKYQHRLDWFFRKRHKKRPGL